MLSIILVKKHHCGGSSHVSWAPVRQNDLFAEDLPVARFLRQQCTDHHISFIHWCNCSFLNHVWLGIDLLIALLFALSLCSHYTCFWYFPCLSNLVFLVCYKNGTCNYTC